MQYDPLSLAPDVTLIKMFILAGLFGIAALIVIAILIAVVARRPGLAAVFGGLALLAIGFGLMASVVAPSAIHIMQPSEMHSSIAVTSHAEHAVPHVVHSSYGGFSVFGMLLFPAIIVAAFIASVVLAKKCNGATRSWWPAMLLIPLAFFLVMGGARYTRTTHVSESPLPPPAPPAIPSPHEAHAGIHHEIEHGEIHMLMDKADAPRIDLAAEAAAGMAAITAGEVAHLKVMKTTSETANDEPRAEATAVDTSHREREEDQPKASARDNRKSNVAKDTSRDAKENQDSIKSAGAEGSGKAQDSRLAEVAVGDAKQKSETESAGAKEEVLETTDDATDPIVGQKTPSEPRPEWASQQPARLGDAWQEVIATDEYATEAECRRATDIYLMFKAYERFQTLAGRPFVDTSLPSITFNKGQVLADGDIIYSEGDSEYWQDSRLNQLLKMGIGIDFIRREVVDKQYMDQSERSFGPMFKMYTLVKFTPEVDAELRRHWAYYQRQDKFEMVGVGAASVLGLLGFIYGLLKVDTLTKGYYTKRLFIGVPAAIIGGTVLFSLLVEVLT